MGGNLEQQLYALTQKMALQQGHAAEQIWSGELEWRNLDQSKGLNTLHSIIISNFVDDQQEVKAEN